MDLRSLRSESAVIACDATVSGLWELTLRTSRRLVLTGLAESARLIARRTPPELPDPNDRRLSLEPAESFVLLERPDVRSTAPNPFFQSCAESEGRVRARASGATE